MCTSSGRQDSYVRTRILVRRLHYFIGMSLRLQVPALRLGWTSSAVDTMSRRHPIARLFLLGGLAITAACATNPVTGNREFVTISEAQEIAIGREADAQIKGEMGVYEDQQLQQYVEEIGIAVAASSHRPDLDWQFAIVDSPVINAFALPGGYIYLTRGMMAYLSDEAELAGVLGHEIGHVTARHSVQAYSRSTGATWGLLAAQIFVPAMRTPYGAPMGLGDAAGAGLGMLFLKFGRDDETQADRLGAEYATLSGWDPRGVGDMLSTLARIADTTDRRGTPNWLSTHPAPVNRVTDVSGTVAQLLTATDSGTLRVDRAGYLDRIEGLIYGDNPADGIVRGNEFLHPALRFALAFPGGWEVRNSETLVVAKQPGRENYMILRLAESSQEDLQRIAERDMIEAGYQPEQGTTSSINGLEAYLGIYTREVDELGPLVARVAYIRAGRSVYVLGGFAPVTEFSYVERDVDASIGSFRQLSRDEAEQIRPNRVTVSVVQDGDTWQRIAQRSGEEIVLASTLAIMNGYPVNEQPAPGDQIKIVVPG